MRIIDADALMRDIEHYHVSDGCFQYWVELQPTIDAKPVVHAHWIHTHTSSSYWTECYKCSACGYEDETFMGTKSDYCSACGAVMDGKDQTDE